MASLERPKARKCVVTVNMIGDRLVRKEFYPTAESINDVMDAVDVGGLEDIGLPRGGWSEPKKRGQ